MVLQIAPALKQPGEVFRASLSESLPPQEYGGREIVFLKPVAVECAYSFDGEALQCDGSIQTALASRCARCDEPFEEPLEIQFSERFVKGAGEDDESYAFEGEFLNIRPMVMDNLFLNMPIKSVCREDCRGLCPVCGCNLNTAQCSCAPIAEEVKSPLAALGSLFDDGKEV